MIQNLAFDALFLEAARVVDRLNFIIRALRRSPIPHLKHKVQIIGVLAGFVSVQINIFGKCMREAGVSFSGAVKIIMHGDVTGPNFADSRDPFGILLPARAGDFTILIFLFHALTVPAPQNVSLFVPFFKRLAANNLCARVDVNKTVETFLSPQFSIRAREALVAIAHLLAHRISRQVLQKENEVAVPIVFFLNARLFVINQIALAVPQRFALRIAPDF